MSVPRLGPRFTPAKTTCGRFGISSSRASLTQSAGLPSTAQAVADGHGGSARRTLRGARIVSAWLTALRSRSGAHTHTSSATAHTDLTRAASPGAAMPSSLEIRTRMIRLPPSCYQLSTSALRTPDKARTFCRRSAWVARLPAPGMLCPMTISI